MESVSISLVDGSNADEACELIASQDETLFAVHSTFVGLMPENTMYNRFGWFSGNKFVVAPPSATLRSYLSNVKAEGKKIVFLTRSAVTAPPVLSTRYFISYYLFFHIFFLIFFF